MSTAVWAVIPAAGSGSRMAVETPKQFLPLAGKTVLEHSIEALYAGALPACIAVALPAYADHPLIGQLAKDKRLRLVTGGATRAESVLAGLESLNEVAAEEDWVLVHDAARPCVDAADIGRLLQAARKNGSGAVLAEPVVDTIKRADGEGRVLATLDRDGLWRIQTPQVFPYGALCKALQRAMTESLTVTDEASAMELAGSAVQVVAGVSTNLKITCQRDLALAEWYLATGGQQCG